MRIRLSRHSAGILLASLGAVTLIVSGAASGAPLDLLPPEDCIPIEMVEDCETPSPSASASGSASESPSEEPSESESPSEEPSEEPSESESPSAEPTGSESPCPTGSEEPSEEPSESESATPSASSSGSPGLLDPILTLLPVAPVPGVSTPASEEPSATETPSEEPTPEPTTGCEVPAAKTVITYAATTRIRYADLYTFSAKVTQAGGVPVPAGQVSFMLPGFTYRAPVGPDGYARVRTRIAVNPGNYRMNLLYTPVEGFQESRQQVGFIVVRTAVSCELYRQVTATQSHLTGALRYPDRSRVPGVGVVFWYNGRALANRVTNTAGVATLATTRGRTGDTFSFTYPGDNKRVGCGTTIRVP